MNKCITCYFSLRLCLHNSTKYFICKYEGHDLLSYDSQISLLTMKSNLVFPDPEDLEGVRDKDRVVTRGMIYIIKIYG